MRGQADGRAHVQDVGEAASLFSFLLSFARADVASKARIVCENVENDALSDRG